jgi:hypothetical protein
MLLSGLIMHSAYLATIYSVFISDNIALTAVMAQPSPTHEDYQIGIICVLATEKAAMVVMLDEHHPRLRKENGDDNGIYSRLKLVFVMSVSLASHVVAQNNE